MRAAERFQRRASIWDHYAPALPIQDGHISGKSRNTLSQAGIHRSSRHNVAGTKSVTRSHTPSDRVGDINAVWRLIVNARGRKLCLRTSHRGVMLTDWSERLSPQANRAIVIVIRKQRCEADGRFVMKPLRGAYMERETGVEPATSTLARSRSTTELLPLGESDYKQRGDIAAITPQMSAGGTPAPPPKLTQPSQLRTCSGFFSMNFIAKSCVSFVAL